MKTRPYKSYIKTEEENRLNAFVGKRLKQARKNIPNLTQAKIGKAIGVSFQQIQNIKVKFLIAFGCGWLPRSILSSDSDSADPTISDTPLKTTEILQNN